MEQTNIVVGSTLFGNITLSFLEIKGENPGPTVGYVAGIHGNELSSIGGLLRYMETIKMYPPNLLQGRIIMLPFANPVALAQSQRGLRMSGDSWTEEKNLNRQFPGNSNGILAERIAHTIFSYFKKAHVDLVVDLHTMHTRSIHMAILDRIPTRKETFDTALNHANKTGL